MPGREEEGWKQEQPTLQECNLSYKPGEKETHLGFDLEVHWKGKEKALMSVEKNGKKKWKRGL